MIFPEFKNKVALITGASGGFGSKLCELFAANGALIYPTDIRSAHTPNFMQGDIADPVFIAKYINNVLDKSGKVDILINNAGICPRTPLFDVTLAEWNKVINVNLTSIFLLSQQCLKIMMEHKSGCIVNVASLAGQNGGLAVGAHYSASKAAVMCLTKTLARTGGSAGIRVNAVAPGIIDTEITRAATEEQKKEFKRAIPLGRIARADEVVNPILFLASDNASYITGATLDINGGLWMD